MRVDFGETPKSTPETGALAAPLASLQRFNASTLQRFNDFRFNPVHRSFHSIQATVVLHASRRNNVTI
jgi:hypothetical protein